MSRFPNDMSGNSEKQIKFVLLLVIGVALIALFKDRFNEPERPEGLVQILPYTLPDLFYTTADEDKRWRVEFTLPPELQITGQKQCEDFVGKEQYLALTTIEPHSENGETRYAPAWIREDLQASTSGRYRCTLNVNGTNIPWQVPKAELEEINSRNRNKNFFPAL